MRGAYWGAVIFNFVPLQGLWLRRVRRSPVLLFLISTSVVVGMWLERYMILVTSLYKDFLPSSLRPLHASFWDWSTYIGMLGLFMTPFLLFVRFLPSISIFEDKEVLRARRRRRRMAEPTLGLLAEFDSAEALLEAAKRARGEGFRCIDAFSPFPVEGMAEVLALKRDHRIGWITIAGGLFGFLGMLAVQLFVNWDYPIEVGNRPAVRLAGLLRRRFRADDPRAPCCSRSSACSSSIGLPKLHHPLFGTPRFGLASRGQVLPLHRRARPEVRPRTRRAASSAASAPGRSRRCGHEARSPPRAARAAAACHQNLTMSDQRKLSEWERVERVPQRQGAADAARPAASRASRTRRCARPRSRR